MGRRKDAIEQFRAAVRLDPLYKQAQINLDRFDALEPIDGPVPSGAK
jgi:hypothetical protein